ncbi:Dienelactone hydrolase family protein [Phycisphaerae bacterium RAS1]|nr:Dienelactone hydrolase family protein [Phycisphaerae bacterium RAS1]
MRASLLAILAALIPLAEAKVVTRPVEYKHGDVALEGFLAFDDAQPGKRPGVLIVHEWWGLNDYAKRRAQQLAEMGYVAFALDMYGKGVVATTREEAQKLSGQFHGSPLMRERARAGLAVLAADEHVDAKRIAASGYCFGGSTVLELAYSGADIAGVVSFHGGLTAPKPEDMKNIKARILVLHGADDPFISADAIAAFQRGMQAAKADWQMVYYGGAVHAFSNPGVNAANIDGAKYDEKADRRSWEDMRQFFREIFGEK